MFAEPQKKVRAAQTRLLAVDLDGTLLNGDRRLNAESAKAVARALDRGVTVVLASGRIYPSMKPFAKALGLTGPLICANGGHIVNGDGTDLTFHCLAPSARETVIEFAIEHRLHLNAYTRDELLFLQETPWSEVYRSRVTAVSSRLASVEELLTCSISIMMLVGEPISLPAYRKAIEPMLDRAIVRVTESEPEYLEFLFAGAAWRSLLA